MSKIPVKAALRAANDFRRAHWRAASGPGAVLALGMAASAGLETFSQSLSYVAVGLEQLAWVMAMAALLRLAFAPDHPGDAAFRTGPLGVQWGRSEWRLLGVCLLIIAAGMAWSFAHSLSMGLLSSATGGGAEESRYSRAATLASSTIVGVTTVAAFYLIGRLALVFAATVDRSRLAIGEAWRATRGHALMVLTATLVILLVTLAMVGIGVFLAVAVSSPFIAGLGGPGAPAFTAFHRALGGLVSGVIIAWFTLPLSAGLTSHLYRVLRDATPASSS